MCLFADVDTLSRPCRLLEVVTVRAVVGYSSGSGGGRVGGGSGAGRGVGGGGGGSYSSSLFSDLQVQ